MVRVHLSRSKKIEIYSVARAKNLVHSVLFPIPVFLDTNNLLQFFCSLPLFRKMPTRAKILILCIGKVLLSLILARVAVSLGYVLMEEDDLSRAVSQFYPSTSGGMSGGPGTPPGPSGDPFFPLASPHLNEPGGNDEASGHTVGNLTRSRQFLRAEGAGPQNPMGMPVGGAEAGLRASLDAGEQEAAAEEDARLYRAVEGINDACFQVQERIVLKTRTLLARKGIALEDPQDVSRAINLAMTEAWEIDIDNRLSNFRNLHRYLGTRNCRLWPEIVKELRDFGNPHVPDAEE